MAALTEKRKADRLIMARSVCELARAGPAAMAKLAKQMDF